MKAGQFCHQNSEKPPKVIAELVLNPKTHFRIKSKSPNISLSSPVSSSLLSTGFCETRHLQAHCRPTVQQELGPLRAYTSPEAGKSCIPSQPCQQRPLGQIRSAISARGTLARSFAVVVRARVGRYVLFTPFDLACRGDSERQHQNKPSERTSIHVRSFNHRLPVFRTCAAGLVFPISFFLTIAARHFQVISTQLRDQNEAPVVDLGAAAY